MFQTLRRTLNRIRFIIGGFRSAMYGLMLVALTWIVAIPPSSSEIARLDLPIDATVQAEGLRHYRMAKLLVMVASDRTYAIIANRAGTEITANDFQLAVQIAANGTPTTHAAQPETGAKFIAPRAN